MHRSLRALGTDLVIRASIVLDSLPPDLKGTAASRASDVRPRLQSLVGETRAFVEQNLEDSAALRANLATYSALSRELRVIELYEVPFLLRWSAADEQLTSFCWRFLDAIGWTYRKPLVGSFSSDYYWVHPRQAVIAVPANEEARLLALGDLCHELGHIVFVKAESELRGDILREIQRWLRAQAPAAAAVLAGRDVADFLNDAFLSWRGWLQEFVCDAIATYLSGPAYGWQHVRLACLDERFGFVFEPLVFEDHPADDARMRLIVATLRVLGEDGAAGELESQWQGLSTLSAPQHPAYDLVYPPQLIEHLARNVVGGSQSIGLRPYVDATDRCDLSVIANEAWKMIRDHPAGYRDWEAATVTTCLAEPTGGATP